MSRHVLQSGPFYLTVIDKPVSSVWYTKTPIGKNTINIIIKKNSPLKDLCPEKNLTNHSARKTVAKKLKSSGIPKCEIRNITGHASATGELAITTQETNNGRHIVVTNH